MLVERKRLLDMLSPVVKVVEKNATIGEATLMRLRTLSVGNDKLLEATATDLEINVRNAVPIEDDSSENFDVLVSDKLYNMLKAIPDEMVTLTFKGTVLELTGKGVRYELTTSDPALFVDLISNAMTGDVEPCLNVDAETMKRALESAGKVVPRSTENFQLRNVCVSCPEEGAMQAHVVATDGASMLVTTVPCEVQMEKEMLLQPKVVSEISKLFDDVERLEFGYTKQGQMLHVSSPESEALLVASVPGSNFPNWKVVADKLEEGLDETTHFLVKLSDFKEALKRVSAALQGAPVGVVHFIFKKRKMLLQAIETGTGAQATVELPAKIERKEIDKISYNVDVLKNLFAGMQAEDEEDIKCWVSQNEGALILHSNVSRGYAMPITE